MFNVEPAAGVPPKKEPVNADFSRWLKPGSMKNRQT
jgi:hypothetical protein